jgi:hypothetical protein
MSHVVELTLDVKQGHCPEGLTRDAQFAHNLAGIDPALIGHIVVGDEAAGIVRGIGARANPYAWSYCRTWNLCGTSSSQARDLVVVGSSPTRPTISMLFRQCLGIAYSAAA